MGLQEIHLLIKMGLKMVVFKVDETTRKFGSEKNKEDNCIYAKFKNEKFRVKCTMGT